MKTIFYISVFFIASFSSFATAGDTTKVKYDINDPRNPDCPCHKYQKLADEEYQRMLGNEAIQTASENVATQINKTKEKTAPEITATAAEDAGTKVMKNEAVQTASENVAGQINKTKEKTAPEITPTTAENGGAKTMKSADKIAGTKKVNKRVFSRRSATHHKSSKPKKRKVRFGRKDNSRCTHW